VRQTGGRLFPACLIGCTIVIASSRAGLPSFLLVVQKKAEMILFYVNGSELIAFQVKRFGRM
jgi:hypothetical protein